MPVIAAVNGPAVGAGLCLALACDLRYAAPSATFSAPFIELGTHGGMAASWLLPEAVGLPRAREMLYTGRVVPADEALAWGLVSGVADDVVGHAVEVRPGCGRGADRGPADQGGPGPGGRRRLRGGPAVGGAGPAGHHGDRRHPQGHPGPPRAPRRRPSSGN